MSRSIFFTLAKVEGSKALKEIPLGNGFYPLNLRDYFGDCPDEFTARVVDLKEGDQRENNLFNSIKLWQLRDLYERKERALKDGSAEQLDLLFKSSDDYQTRLDNSNVLLETKNEEQRLINNLRKLYIICEYEANKNDLAIDDIELNELAICWIIQ